MEATKKRRLAEAGWQIGTASEFLELSAEEEALIETRIALTKLVRERRLRGKLTQIQLAKLLGSSQSRVAKLEAGDASVSTDLLLRAAYAVGASLADVGSAIRNADLDTRRKIAR
jgi:DNA-binding XRE family transcriptional regulator